MGYRAASSSTIVESISKSWREVPDNIIRKPFLISFNPMRQAERKMTFLEIIMKGAMKVLHIQNLTVSQEKCRKSILIK
jgi:hypothetical protein